MRRKKPSRQVQDEAPKTEEEVYRLAVEAHQEGKSNASILMDGYLTRFPRGKYKKAVQELRLRELVRLGRFSEEDANEARKILKLPVSKARSTPPKKKPLRDYKAANENRDDTGDALALFDRAVALFNRLGGEERLKKTIGIHSVRFGTDGSFVFQFRAKAKDGINRVMVAPGSVGYDVIFFRGTGDSIERVRTLSGLNMLRLRLYLNEYLGLEL